MNHLDLFSGIGGFALAAQWVWGEEHHIHSFVEIDPFCQKVLKKHWPDTPIHSDIKEYKHDGTAIDLITGGFPCQPFSAAGKRKGTEDDRHLWPEMLRVISEVHPRWVIAENVAGLISSIGKGLVLEQVFLDLEGAGYQVQPFVIPACAVNAPHRRDRIWIVAHSEIVINRGTIRTGDEKKVEKQRPKNEHKNKTKRLVQTDSHAPDTQKAFRRRDETPENNTRWRRSEIGRQVCPNWSEDWYSVAIRTCVRGMDDGIPRNVDRVNRLKALGNAIVPQCVYPIMQAIKQIDGE